MRLPLLLILLPLLALSADFYIFRRNFRHKSKWIKILWWGLSLVTLLLVYRGDGAIRFSGEARYKYLHVDILYFLLGLHAQMVLLHIFSIRLRPPSMEKEEREMGSHDRYGISPVCHRVHALRRILCPTTPHI